MCLLHAVRENSVKDCWGLWKTSGFHRYDSTWYPYKVCRFLKLKHPIHFPLKKRLIERTIQYFKDITEKYFDCYFPCRLKNLIEASMKLAKIVYRFHSVKSR